VKVLLDTHAFLWFDAAPEKLSNTAAEVLRNPDHEIYLSIASVWEIQIKTQLRRLELRVPLGSLVQSQCTTNNIRVLPIELQHLYALADLPPHHNDPFDRLLLAQARAENFSLMSNDAALAAYDAQLIW
jgi:PIN domain nuclease of toxin-antitoxin system